MCILVVMRIIAMLLRAMRMRIMRPRIRIRISLAANVYITYYAATMRALPVRQKTEDMLLLEGSYLLVVNNKKTKVSKGDLHG